MLKKVKFVLSLLGKILKGIAILASLFVICFVVLFNLTLPLSRFIEEIQLKEKVFIFIPLVQYETGLVELDRVPVTNVRIKDTGICYYNTSSEKEECAKVPFYRLIELEVK